MKLKVGDILVKKRGGASKKVKVLRVGRLSAILEDMAPSANRRGSSTRAVNLDGDGLPEGYRREVRP